MGGVPILAALDVTRDALKTDAHQEGCCGREQGLVPLSQQHSSLLIDSRAASKEVERGRLARPARAAEDSIYLRACQGRDQPYSSNLCNSLQEPGSPAQH